MASDGVSGTERVIFSTDRADRIRSTLDAYARARVGSGIEEVIFRAGRVDAVWAIHLSDGRDVLIKAHRQPVDLTARLATIRAQRVLSAEGFPCPAPVCDSADFEGLILTTEALITVGSHTDARIPEVRASLARGLAEHVEMLRAWPDIAASAGPGPAWCRYQDGPWPIPHDPIFDFTRTPDGFGWLDDFAAAMAEMLRQGQGNDSAVGHADWYVGNARFDGTELVGTFDWDLVAGPEPHIAGFAAAAFTDGGVATQDLPSPDEVRAFLIDYDQARTRPFTKKDQEQASAAVAWTMAYNARCQVAFLDGPPPPGTALHLLSDQRDAYAAVRW
ncbi:protein kinase family protein [Planctomonas psychrotolerans]|uniref:hypothetical protein n=1 Tax=Planctomonas psychrotolerans TaxID=2528712 RepID=UPI00123B3207|nr:hypothetical protein [Planctomonas psychrotolerans]